MTQQSGGAVSGVAGGVLGGTYPSPTFATNGTTPILGTVSSVLAADVSIPSATTYVNGPAVTLTAGTWLVLARAQISAGGTSQGFGAARLTDGTTIYAEGVTAIPVIFQAGIVPLTTVVVVASGTLTLTLQAQTQTGGGTLRAQTITAVNADTSVIALRIA